MKTYTIGRDTSCDIVINDSTDVVSRRHALLNVVSAGKMTIVDQSSNGTYVNGIRIASNVPVPVTRKDMISLAHVAKFDWNMVPKSKRPVQYAVFGLVGVLIVAGVAYGLSSHQRMNTELPPVNNSALMVDSIALEQAERARADSLRLIRRVDSLSRELAERKNRTQRDSIAKLKKAEERQRQQDSIRIEQNEKEETEDSARPKQDIG